jgi:hypothetical protein
MRCSKTEILAVERVPYSLESVESFKVAMNSLDGEGGNADGNVFGSVFEWGGVLDPLAFVGDDGLSGGNVEAAGLVLDSQHAL